MRHYSEAAALASLYTRTNSIQAVPTAASQIAAIQT